MSLPVAYWHPDLKRAVLFDAAALAGALAHRQSSENAKEAGGVLIGEQRGEHLWVREITPPQADDVRTRTTFLRRSSNHQRLVDEAWARTNGQMSYIGEWHTHPENDPVPSIVDRASLVLRSLQARQTLVVLIVGLRSNFVALQTGLMLGACELQPDS